jgi:AraC-like DNA-binding protein
LDDLAVGGDEFPERCRVDAWAPSVPGISEVFHAHMVDFGYPPHCHDTWTVLIVDDGAIRYDLDTRHNGAAGETVAVLPPGVIHDGSPAPGRHEFRKRNLYLDQEFLPAALVGPAVDHTTINDPQLREAIAGLHDSLTVREESLDAEARLALIADRLVEHLTGTDASQERTEKGLAFRLRELLDEHTVDAITLEQAAAILGRSVSHLVRSFTGQFGVSPHAYVVGRRVEAARHQLLRGARPADVAVAVGFYDQAHFTRHFKRHTSTSPARYARSHR